MAPHNLGIKKGGRINKIKKHGGHVPPLSSSSLCSISSMPNELLVEIFTKVASRSIVDLCKVKLSCKEFQRAAEDDRVYHNASMDNFALVPLPWFTHEKESSFLKRCRESGNAEISYREAMLQFFSYSNDNSKVGLEILKNAAMDGHDDAKYVYSMVLMNGEDEGERMKGFEVFRGLKASTCTRRCRKRVKCFVRSLWVNNPVVRRDQHSLCRSSECGTSVMINMMQNLSRRRWNIEDEDSDAVSCEYCRADYELSLFCKMFEA